MKLTFIPSDFVNLQNPILMNTAEGTNDSTIQFGNIHDCAYMRAMRREDWEPRNYSLKYNAAGLNDIREQLLAGEESVTIEIDLDKEI